VCKLTLQAAGVAFDDNWDLPKLYHETCQALVLTPSQQTDAAYRAMLGTCQSVVNSLAVSRNREGDAHGRVEPVAPAPRHARLIVGIAGALAVFLIETWEQRSHVSSGAADTW
jgi:hypothetical protein